VYNVYDGTAGAEDLNRMEASAKAKIEDSKNNKDLTEDKRKSLEARALSTLRTVKDRRERSITSLPPLINVLGYAFNPTSVMSGPAFEYTMYESSLSRDKNPEDAPSRVIPVIIKVTYAVTCLLNTAIYKNIYSLDSFYKTVLLRVNNDPNAPSFISHVMAYYVTFFVLRLQYYGVWKLSEGAAVLAGFGYQNSAKGNLLFSDIEWVIGEENFTGLWKLLFGSYYERILAMFGLRLKTSKNPIPDWEGATNVAPLSEETRRLPGELIRVWNVHTQSWLERYILKRAPRASGLNRWMTYFASAFWHGFAPGYYLALLSAPFVLESARVVKESCGPFLDFLGIRWFFQPERNSIRYLILVIAHWMFLQACWMYTFGPFMLYGYRKGLNFWQSYYYSGHLIALSFYIFTFFLKIFFPKTKKEKKKDSMDHKANNSNRIGVITVSKFT
jgi:lysophospholipid acyltransferase